MRRKAFAILLLQDLAIVPLLALVAVLSPREVATDAPWVVLGKMVAAVAAVVGVGRWLLSPLFRLLAASRAREVMTAAALLLVIGSGAVMTLAGLSPALGAFLAGLMLAESSYRHELEADIEPFRGLLLGLFFMSIGMSVDLGVVARHGALLLGALVTLTAVKLGVVYALVRASGAPHTVATRTAAILPQGGEFGFVLFSAAGAAGVMPPDQPVLLIALVTLSLALTPLIVRLAPLVAPDPGPRTRDERFDGADGSVLVVGFGRFGQVVCQLLLRQGLSVTIIDNDLDMIDAAGRFGFRVYFGDGTRLDVLRAAGAERVRLLCVCVDKPATATRIVEIAREAFPLTPVYARAYDRVHALVLVERGVDYQIRETLESALAFGREALVGLGMAPDEIAETEADVRKRDAERFTLQQQGQDPREGGSSLYTRPVPRPEPLVPPQRESVRLDPGEAPTERDAQG